jgi:ubiquinone/menaquinone biosynthesis C-methylase UbiE
MQSSGEARSENGHICPWWLAYTFDNPLRKLFHKPRVMLAPYVKEGMRVLDAGCGMGFFSIGMAKLVGDHGRVFSVDLQPKMLQITDKRARRAGLKERIGIHRCTPDTLGIDEKVDFILAFYMVHEVPDQDHFFRQLRSILNPGGKILIAEPRFHVSEKDFLKTIQIAESNRLKVCERPAIRLSLAAVLEDNEYLNK